MSNAIFFVLGAFTCEVLRRFAFPPRVAAAATRPSEGDVAVPAEGGASASDECKMVLVVRTDLNMGKGKIGAQCGHAALAGYKKALKRAPGLVRAWEEGGQAKIAVKVEGEEALMEIRALAEANGLPAACIFDAGRTQIAAGSATVLAIGPAPRSAVDKVTGHLKLL